jgi:pimeloyl-ACP methyl ester carboxylesterase
MAETTCNGVRLAWENFGEGEPVLLIAGTNMPPVMWQLALVPALVDAKFRVVTFANRGVDPSEAPTAPYSVAEMANDTAALIEALDLAPSRLVGYSLGGFIAEELCVTRPDLVREAVLMASAGRASSFLRLYVRAEIDLAEAMDPQLPTQIARDSVMFVQPTAVLQNDDDVVELMREMIEASPPWTNPGRLGQWQADLAWLEDETRVNRWPDLRQRALVIGFEHDVAWPPVRVREAAAIMPNARYEQICGAAHGGLLTHGDEVSKAIVNFFTAI